MTHRQRHAAKQFSLRYDVWQPDLVEAVASSNEDDNVPVPHAKKQETSSKRLTFTEIENLVNDSGSEEEEVEEFFGLDDDDMESRPKLGEECCLIENNFNLLHNYKNYEKERWLSIEMEDEEPLEADDGAVEESVDVDYGAVELLAVDYLFAENHEIPVCMTFDPE